MNRQPQLDEIRRFATMLAVALLGVAVAAFAAAAADTMPVREAVIAVNVGQPEAGVRVYALPRVHVVASRKVELERIAREALELRARQARWKAPSPAV